MSFKIKSQNRIDIKQYKIIEKLGFGSSDSVYKVETSNGEIYAAKIINSVDNDEQNKKMILQEIKTQLYIHHPTIIRHFGYSKVNINGENNLTIIIEFAENGSLYDVIESNKKSQCSSSYNNTKRQIIIAGIAKGMKYLHDRSIIHGDLKPNNILLNKYYHPLITDIFMSKIKCKSENSDSKTLKYVAPEILKNEKIDKKVDVYAFGILMYEILTELDSFVITNNEEFVRKVVHENLRPKFDGLHHINESLQKLMKDCWSDDPKLRPTFDEIFNKLSKANKYLLNNVDIDEFQNYIDQITEANNPIEETLIDKIKKIEEENKQLKEKYTKLNSNKKIDDELNKMKLKNEEYQKMIQKFIELNQKLRTENEKCNLNLKQLKYKNEQQMRTINRYEQENQKLLLGNEKYKQDLIQISSKNESQQRKIKNLEDEIKQLKFGKNSIKLSNSPYQPQYTFRPNRKDNEQKNSDLNHHSKISEPLSQIKILNTDGKPSPKSVRTSIFNRNQNDNMIISEFNVLPLKSQLSVSKKLSKSNDYEIKSFFTKVNELIVYFDNFKQITNSCIEIKGDETEQLTKVHKNQCIQITHIATEMIFNCSSLDIPSFTSILNKFDKVSFELAYPTETFDQVYNFIQKLEISTSEKFDFLIGLFMTSNIKIGPNILKNKSISYIRFDNSIKHIMSLALCSSILQITLSSSLTKIGRYAFSKCSSLTQMSIPPSVTSIGNNSFSYCSSLLKITIPLSVTRIGFYAFSDCSSLEQISIPSSITLIKAFTFNKCKSLKQIKIPSSVTKIEKGAFFNCSSLTEIEIPSSVTEIDDIVFSGCFSLTKISIPSSINKFGKDIFVGVKKLNIIGDFKMITKKMFSSCLSLTQISIPSSVTKIGDRAFYKCLSLTQITIPSSVASIGWNAFRGCSSLLQITIPNSVSKIEACTFEGCSSLKQILIPFSVTKIGESAFEGCSSMTQISIPSSVTSIGWNVFKECSSLKQISIPSSVTKIEVCAFQGCNSLEQITIPFSVTEIGNRAFCGCTSLSQISIPSSVMSIKSGAFAACTSLKQISIPFSVISIEDGAFYECKSLTKISIPNSVTYFGKDIFYKCSSLKEITIPSSLNFDLNEFGSNVKIKRV